MQLHKAHNKTAKTRKDQMFAINKDARQSLEKKKTTTTGKQEATNGKYYECWNSQSPYCFHSISYPINCVTQTLMLEHLYAEEGRQRFILLHFIYKTQSCKHSIVFSH